MKRIESEFYMKERVNYSTYLHNSIRYEVEDGITHRLLLFSNRCPLNSSS